MRNASVLEKRIRMIACIMLVLGGILFLSRTIVSAALLPLVDTFMRIFVICGFALLAIHFVGILFFSESVVGHYEERNGIEALDPWGHTLLADVGCLFSHVYYEIPSSMLISSMNDLRTLTHREVIRLIHTIAPYDDYASLPKNEKQTTCFYLLLDAFYCLKDYSYTGFTSKRDSILKRDFLTLYEQFQKSALSKNAIAEHDIFSCRGELRYTLPSPSQTTKSINS